MQHTRMSQALFVLHFVLFLAPVHIVCFMSDKLHFPDTEQGQYPLTWILITDVIEVLHAPACMDGTVANERILLRIRLFSSKTSDTLLIRHIPLINSLFKVLTVYFYWGWALLFPQRLWELCIVVNFSSLRPVSHWDLSAFGSTHTCVPSHF